MADIRCSFCGIELHQADRMISGPAAFICDRCVGLCAGILVNDRAAEDPKPIARSVEKVCTVEALQYAIIDEMRHRLSDSEIARRKMVETVTRLLEEIATATGIAKFARCRWCGIVLDDSEAADHVAHCDKHPAVIRLREIEASRG